MLNCGPTDIDPSAWSPTVDIEELPSYELVKLIDVINVPTHTYRRMFL